MHLIRALVNIHPPFGNIHPPVFESRSCFIFFLKIFPILYTFSHFYIHFLNFYIRFPNFGIHFPNLYIYLPIFMCISQFLDIFLKLRL